MKRHSVLRKSKCHGGGLHLLEPRHQQRPAVDVSVGHRLHAICQLASVTSSVHAFLSEAGIVLLQDVSCCGLQVPDAHQCVLCGGAAAAEHACPGTLLCRQLLGNLVGILVGGKSLDQLCTAGVVLVSTLPCSRTALKSSPKSCTPFPCDQIFRIARRRADRSLLV